MARPIHSSQMNRPDFLDQSSPDKAAGAPGSSPLPWYKVYRAESFTEESDHREDDLDVLTAAASTPLHVNDGKSAIFTSPLNKLNRLDLNNSSPNKSNQRKAFDSANLSNNPYSFQSDTMRPRPNGKLERQPDEDDDDESDVSHDEIGNITFVDATNFNTENEDTADDEDGPLGASLGSLEPPTYIRKRKLVESSADTPVTHTFSSTEKVSLHNVADMSGVIGNETNESLSKISFSASDSTPCPPQPRKKLKLKSRLQDTTPSQPSRITGPLLDLTSSRKLSISSVPLLSKLNNATVDITDNNSSFNSLSSASKFSSKSKINSTPISQSTPANSRSNSPAYFTDESDEEINGYKFVKPNMKFNYETPQPRRPNQIPQSQNSSSAKSVNEYNTGAYSGGPFGNYKIVGDFPVSAAGLMDEEAANVHIADKRIGDPYLSASPSSFTNNDSHSLFISYSKSQDKLPLVEHFKRDLDLAEMKLLIDDGISVKTFYEKVIVSSEFDLRTFLKRERLRWHPDKWESKLEGSPFDETVIVHLSQVINGILEDLRI